MNFWDRIAEWYHGSLLRELLEYLNEQVFGMEFGEYSHFTVSVKTAETLRTVILAIAAGLIVASFLAVYVKTVPGGFVRKLLKQGIHSPEKAVTLREVGYFRSVGVRRELSCGGALSKVVWRVGDEAEHQLPATGSDAEKATSEPAAEDEKTSNNAPQVCNSAENTTNTAESVSEETSGNVAPSGRESANETADGLTNSAAAPAAAPVVTKPYRFLTDRFYIPEDLRYRAEFRYDRRGSGWPMLILAVAATVLIAFLLCRFLPSVLGLLDGLATLIGG